MTGLRMLTLYNGVWRTYIEGVKPEGAIRIYNGPIVFYVNIIIDRISANVKQILFGYSEMHMVINALW